MCHQAHLLGPQTHNPKRSSPGLAHDLVVGGEGLLLRQDEAEVADQLALGVARVAVDGDLRRVAVAALHLAVGRRAGEGGVRVLREAGVERLEAHRDGADVNVEILVVAAYREHLQLQVDHAGLFQLENDAVCLGIEDLLIGQVDVRINVKRALETRVVRLPVFGLAELEAVGELDLSGALRVGVVRVEEVRRVGGLEVLRHHALPRVFFRLVRRVPAWWSGAAGSVELGRRAAAASHGGPHQPALASYRRSGSGSRVASFMAILDM